MGLILPRTAFDTSPLQQSGWSTAVPDWKARIVAGTTLLPVVPIDEVRAAKALRIFKRLRLTDLPGRPTMGEVCADWVFDFVRVIFGTYDTETKQRAILEFFLLISKKNGKSSIAAGIMLTALILNEREQGEFLILAPTKDVADNSFGPAAAMVNADPVLLARFKPSTTVRRIENRLDGSVLEVKSADADVVGGQKAIAIFVDELWLFGKKASAENILSEATGSLASRDEGFVVYATTQSDDAPSGVFRNKLHYFRKVRDGEIADKTSLPLIYEYPEEMMKRQAWRDPATWYIPNPNLGLSVNATWIGSTLFKKEQESPTALKLFVAKHFNVEVGLGIRTDGWTGAEHWEKRADPLITFRSLFKLCDVIVPGVDGGGLDDLYGLSLLGRHKETRDWLLWTHAWCHKGVLDRRKSIASKLLDFQKAGDLTIVDDELEDISKIVRIIALVQKYGLLGGVAVDPAGIGELVDALATIKVTAENKLLIGAPQGYALMNAIKTCERMTASGRLRHAPSEMMDWCISNLKIEPTATAIRATKQNAGDAKIDPVMAMFDSAVLMQTNPEPTGRSVLKRRGLLVL